MIRAIVDEAVPADFTALFEDSEITIAAFPNEWRSSSDGEIVGLSIAAGYDWLITCDKQMPYQQNLSGKSLAVLVLPTPQIPKLEQICPALIEALRTPAPGNFVVLDGEGMRTGNPVPHVIGCGR